VDGYRWCQYGTKHIPRSNPLLKKIHFAVAKPSGGYDLGFKKQAYIRLSAEQKAVVIHYLGDEGLAEDYPHGNTKSSSNKPYHRSCPSLLTKLAATTDLPSNVYKNAIANNCCTAALQPSSLPRNTRQITNIQQKERQKFRLTHDAIYNLHEMSYDMNDFVKIISTFPDLIVIFGLDVITKELNLLLNIQTENQQLLSYDTTFKLGDFYLSVVLFRYTVFKTSPVVPALFLIHERKFQSVHEQVMKCLAKAVPNLVKGKIKVPFVTDEEEGISNAIEKHLPNVIRLRCWNHTVNSIKVGLKKHGANNSEIPAYVSHLRELLNEDNVHDYDAKLCVLSKTWSKAYYDYFHCNIHPQVNVSLGKWVLEPLNLYHPFSGITNNQSESFNSVLKRLQRWKEVPPDSIVLTLYHLQAYYYNEIQRGFAGLGSYELSPQHNNAVRPLDELSYIPCFSPTEVVEKIRREQNISKENLKVGTQEEVVDPNLPDKAAEAGDLIGGEGISQSIPGTSEARARFIIDNQQISHNQSLGVFTVVGTSGNAHAVRLFPKESCTCPSTNTCYHILAVRMSVGLVEKSFKKRINLTQLRHNTRPRTQKKSGRKAPRAGDYDIEPAPDSIIKEGRVQEDDLSFEDELEEPSQLDLFSNDEEIIISIDEVEKSTQKEDCFDQTTSVNENRGIN
jgi:hypothetical protein